MNIQLLITFAAVVFLYCPSFGQKTEQNNFDQETEIKELLYPNPSYGKLRVNLSDYNHAYYDLSVKNIIGKNLWSKRIVDEIEIIELFELRKGSYLFSVASPSGEFIEVVRLIIIDP